MMASLSLSAIPAARLGARAPRARAPARAYAAPPAASRGLSGRMVLSPGLPSKPAAPTLRRTGRPAAVVTAAAGPVLTNCTGAAAGVFNNIRIPAMLLAGAALGQIWAQFGDTSGEQKSFTLLMSITVMCEFLAVLIGTTMGVRLMADGFNPMATSAVAMLIREFELPYLATRFCFFTGFLTFTLSLILRSWRTLGPNLAKACGFLFAGGGCLMVNIFNSTVVNYAWGYLGVAYRLVVLCACSCKWQNPLALATAGCLAASLFFATQSFISEEKPCHADHK